MKSALRRQGVDVWAAGRALVILKSKVKHGEFGAVKKELTDAGFGSSATLNRAMNVGELAPEDVIGKTPDQLYQIASAGYAKWKAIQAGEKVEPKPERKVTVNKAVKGIVSLTEEQVRENEDSLREVFEFLSRHFAGEQRPTRIDNPELDIKLKGNRAADAVEAVEAAAEQ